MDSPRRNTSYRKMSHSGSRRSSFNYNLQLEVHPNKHINHSAKLKALNHHRQASQLVNILEQFHDQTSQLLESLRKSIDSEYPRRTDHRAARSLPETLESSSSSEEDSWIQEDSDDQPTQEYVDIEAESSSSDAEEVVYVKKSDLPYNLLAAAFHFPSASDIKSGKNGDYYKEKGELQEIVTMRDCFICDTRVVLPNFTVARLWPNPRYFISLDWTLTLLKFLCAQIKETKNPLFQVLHLTKLQSHIAKKLKEYKCPHKCSNEYATLRRIQALCKKVETEINKKLSD